jgi:tetratricopeptide (TPR) repeat protein
MSPTSEEHLQEAVRFHQSSDFKKGIKEAESARKKFQKEGRSDRAAEALRVLADCTLNARDLKNAEKLYRELFNEGLRLSNFWFQSAAWWGLGQVSLFTMNYLTAQQSFQKGLDFAKKVADAWYTAWNAFGLGTALRGLARLDEAKRSYKEALTTFRGMGQATPATWVERALSEIGADIPADESMGEIRLWLCPMCGSKFNPQQASALRSGKMATCDYCGTTVG